jgi:hypothetical protein
VFARQQGRVFMHPNARKVWARAYDTLSEGQPGLFGAVTSRSEAQVVRLALLYALLDMRDKICTRHLQAALALWQYCEESARFIFGGLSPEQLRILEVLSDGQSRTKTEIRNLAFSGHRDAAQLDADLDGLEKAGGIDRKKAGGSEQFSVKV